MDQISKFNEQYLLSESSHNSQKSGNIAVPPIMHLFQAYQIAITKTSSTFFYSTEGEHPLFTCNFPYWIFCILLFPPLKTQLKTDFHLDLIPNRRIKFICTSPSTQNDLNCGVTACDEYQKRV